MMSTSKAVLDAMREDFEQLPPDARVKLLDIGVSTLLWTFSRCTNQPL